MFDYKKYRQKKITLQQIDSLIDLAVVAPTSKMNAIISGVKLLLVAGFLIARAKLVEDEMLASKQEYQRERSRSEQDDLDDL